MFSIYIKSDEGDNGHIKFGGYDKHAIMRGDHLVNLTMDPKSASVFWALFKVNEHVVDDLL